MANSLWFETARRADVLLVVLCPHNDRADELGDQLLNLVQRERPAKLLVDLADEGFFGDCLAAGATFKDLLVRVWRALKANGGLLKVSRMPDWVREAYRLSNLDGTVFDIHDSIESALSAFAAVPPCDTGEM